MSAPACSLDVLDRWLARDEFYPVTSPPTLVRLLRRRIYDLCIVAAAKQESDFTARTNAGQPPHADYNESRLEDPAVGGLVVTAQLFRRDGMPVSGSIEKTFVVWPSGFDQYIAGAVLPSDLEGFRRADANTTFTIGTPPPGEVGVSVTPPASGAGPKIQVTVKAGDLALVTFHAAVKYEHFDIDHGATTARFDPIVLPDPCALNSSPPDAAPRSSIIAPDGTKYMLFDPIEIVVEAAQPQLPSPEDLYAACGFKVRPGDDQRQILLEWTRPAGVSPPNQDGVKWDAVGAVETGDVAWSFTGRPVTRYPFEAPSRDEIPGADDTPSTNPLLWEIETFADRATLAPDVKVFSIPLAPDGTTSKIPIQTLGPRGPAGVKRYQVVARNRYAAAYRQVPGASVVASQRAKLSQTRMTSPPAIWVDSFRRLVVPAVLPDTIPEPSIRALVPLTRSMGDTASPAVAGLLVVLDGAFGDVGGVAEWLDAGVEVVERTIPYVIGQQPNDAVPAPTLTSPPTNSPPNIEKFLVRRAEIGADPILRAGPRGDSSGSPPASVEGYRFMPLEVSGPLGHTFDTAATVGLFNATSFVIEPPQIAAHDPGAWWMAKLKLRRTIMAEGIALPSGTIDPIPLGPGASITIPPGPLSPPSPSAGNLDQWSITLPGLPLANAHPATTEYLIVYGERVDKNGQNLPDGARQMFVCWRRDGQNIAVWPTLTTPAASDSAPAEAWHIPPPPEGPPPRVDLRLTFSPNMQRVQVLSSPPHFSIVVTYDASLQVRAGGQWVFVGDFVWWNDSQLPDGTYDERLRITLTRADSLPGQITASSCISPQASDWVVSHWGQFLPDADHVSNVPLDSASLTLTSGNPPGLRFDRADWWLSASNLASRANQSNQGLLHLVMLSRQVRSASGRDSEAYLGLYYADAPTFGASLLLKPFGNQPSSTDSIGAGRVENLRWRLFTVRAFKSTLDVEAALAGHGLYPSDPPGDPWALFFPQETDNGITVVPDRPTDATLKPRDALLQIIEVSGWQPVTSGT